MLWRTTIACGHRRIASAIGIALLMPNVRASYEHDATTPRRDRAADEHGLAAQRRIIPLLDRRVERVEVDVQDRPHIYERTA